MFNYTRTKTALPPNELGFGVVKKVVKIFTKRSRVAYQNDALPWNESATINAIILLFPLLSIHEERREFRMLTR